MKILSKSASLYIFAHSEVDGCTKLIVEILPGYWILQVVRNTVDPYIHSVCDNTKELLFPPDEGFVRQINVTVGIALLVSWAARSNIIAVRVLQQLIAGRDDPAQDWRKVAGRLPYIEKLMKKELKGPPKWYCPESIAARLRSPFFLPYGTRYPKLLSCKQKEKSDRMGVNGYTKPGRRGEELIFQMQFC